MAGRAADEHRQTDHSEDVRIRVNGLVVLDRALLMVQLMSPVANRLIWMPPGGGVKFGETLQAAAKREILEETNLVVDVGPLWYLNEIHSPGIHAVEFYFRCSLRGGSLETGRDPEYGTDQQIIRDAAFIPIDELVRPDIHPEYLRSGFAGDFENESAVLPRFISV
ncbi:NUDIX hydrolase [Balneolales bacterium ANBcel1]|nr:NUDIX hydrolase [Balneolales bacterium ANBcel1]